MGKEKRKSALSGLNPRQQEAVRHGEGPLLILAGAGTGKTRTLASRVAYLIEQGVAAETILAVSFTNKAAEELKERVQGILGGRRKPPLVSTFHSFCVRVLRRDIGRLGYKRNFSIYDTTDQLAVVRELSREVSLGAGDLDARRLLWIISRAKSDGRRPDAGDGSDHYAVLAAAMYPRYGRALRAYNAVDFDDLLLLTLRLFSDESGVLEKWQARCRHILVDEFQDTNAVQYRLVSLLAAPGGNLTVVGDDDQSIYGWRGAAPGNLFDFTRDWPEARVITLDQNYRSTGRILAAANAVIRENPRRRPKKLWSELGAGPAVTVMRCADSEQEAQAVVERILSLLAGGRCRAGDCAVIFRTNAQSRPFEDALRRAGISYHLIGGLRFYDRKEVRDLLAYLAAVHNANDEVSLLRILNYPARGIGRETVLRLQERSVESGRPLREVMADGAGVGPRQSRALDEFLGLLKSARNRFKAGRLAEAAHDLVREVDLEGEIYRTVKDANAVRRKVENIREVIAALEVFQRENPKAGLGEYLVGIHLRNREEETEGFTDRAVTLLTVHAAKGLEFPHVFFAGFEEGLLPHERSVADPGGVEEERRLAYVGMTRARETLFVSHASARLRYAKVVPKTPSRFLKDFPEDGVQHLDLGQGGTALLDDDVDEADLARSLFDRFRD